MVLGRPVGSMIRQNIVEILHVKGKTHGYELYKDYVKLFPNATQRVIYYHLKKGLDTGEFKVEAVKKEKGDYSWGEMAEKIYYVLGSSAEPKGLARVKKYFEKKEKVSKKQL